jgi:hypothetical protein
VLLVFGAPSQLKTLAGQDHGQTIPLADIAGGEYRVLDRDKNNSMAGAFGAVGSNRHLMWKIEADVYPFDAGLISRNR